MVPPNGKGTSHLLISVRKEEGHFKYFRAALRTFGVCIIRDFLLSDFPLPSGVKLVPESQTSLNLSWDRVEELTKEEWAYGVVCHESVEPENNITYHLPRNSTGLPLEHLKPKQRYQCTVCVMAGGRCRYSQMQQVAAWTLSNGEREVHVAADRKQVSMSC